MAHSSGNIYQPNWDRLSRSAGYLVVYCPGHPRAWSTGYVHVHRVIAEEKLGRILQSSEIVHHKDGNRLNNLPENLEITNRSSHARHHGLQQGKTFVELICDGCGAAFTCRKGNESAVKGGKRSFCSRRCYWNSKKGPRQ